MLFARLASSSLVALSLLAPLAAPAQVSISIGIAPPPLPVYRQPLPPGDGFLWTPGYWAWNAVDAGYYWVPGTWVRAPRPGYLWTPGYWSFVGTTYRWNRGYWGPRVGFYGGIAYGFGYTGHGYQGGRWDRGVFHYNTAVNNVNTTVVRNVYRTEVVNNNTYNVQRVSYNGGAGVRAEPTNEEKQARQAQVVDPTPNQVEHERKALKAPEQKASRDKDGAPRVVATTKPAALDAPDAVRGSDRPADQQNDRKSASAKDADKGGTGKSTRKAERNAEAGTARPTDDDADAKQAAAKNGTHGADKPARAKSDEDGARGSAAATRADAERGDGNQAARPNGAGKAKKERPSANAPGAPSDADESIRNGSAAKINDAPTRNRERAGNDDASPRTAPDANARAMRGGHRTPDPDASPHASTRADEASDARHAREDEKERQ